MPFGSKPDPSGGPNIDFDRIYDSAIRPGIHAARMQPLRADEEQLGGIIHKAMFERLLVCSYALADLTTSNPNVLYELGVRHTARPGTTLTVFARSTPLPFDVRMLRTQPYDLAEGNQFPDEEAARLRDAVTWHLETLREANEQDGVRDSPLFELVPAWNPAPLALDTADSFRADVRASERLKAELDQLGALAEEDVELDEICTKLGSIRARITADGPPDSAVLIKLMLVHRSIADWSGMIDVQAAMPPELARQAPIQQQLGFAFNRRAEVKIKAGDVAGAATDRAAALTILLNVEKEQGPSSETSGLIGRIYKSRWLRARADGDVTRADVFLEQAVTAYLRGFHIDWRDVYPGVNAATLLLAQRTEESRQRMERILPVVRFAAEQHLEASHDYWDYATMLEVLVLTGDQTAASAMLPKVLASRTERWQSQTTADNLRIIQSVQSVGEVAWLATIINRLSTE